LQENKIYNSYLFFDIYIPSLKLAFIIDRFSGILKYLPKNVEKYENSNLMYNNLITNVKKRDGIDVVIVPDYLIEDHLVQVSKKGEESNEESILSILIKTTLEN